MRNVNKKSIIIYILMLSYTFFFNIFRYKYHSNAIINLINPLFYIIIFIISLLLSNTDHKQRIKEKVNKYQTMFIIITSYLIIYILLGLFLGYVRTIYDHSIIGIIKNIWIGRSFKQGRTFNKNSSVKRKSLERSGLTNNKSEL